MTALLQTMCNRLLIVLAVVTALGVAGCSGVQVRERGDSLLLGTAMRTINPPLGVPLVGYPSGRPKYRRGSRPVRTRRGIRHSRQYGSRRGAGGARPAPQPLL